MMNILVVGGAGYIGSHMVKLLSKESCKVTTLDNLSTGYRDAVKYGEFIHADLADKQQLENIFSANQYDAVMHFASFIQVGESVTAPSKYYENNVVNTLNLLNAMLKADVKKFIFSSTAATFGEPLQPSIDESHPQHPINPYGHTKLMVEQILKDYDVAYGLKSVSLRYFNAAGADPDGELGEGHEPETHLIPLVLQAASGRRNSISVFGRDYDTPDGTCVRDYIHVTDLCQAHWLALRSLSAGGETQAYNLGNGAGFSVQEVIDTAKQVTGRNISVVEGPRRAGDPARLVADSKKIREALGWTPIHPSLHTIVTDAWNWELSRAPSQFLKID